MRNVLIFLALTSMMSCKPSINLSDNASTAETLERYQKMHKLSKKGILIGYEDALAYGIDWWADEGMCDMYRVSGQYPAIYGWDMGDIHKSENLDSVSFDNMVSWIQKVHRNGGINTISWHMDNPITGASSWDKSNIAAEILPGGIHHQKFLDRLDMGANFLKRCKIDDVYVPIIFRPYHEHNGNWFWWGNGNLDEEQYKALFRFTVNYFREKHQIHHLIYAFSPDRSRILDVENKENYLWGYPGDEYVDIIGIDNYMDMRPLENDSTDMVVLSNFVKSLEMITDIAEEKGKIAALTETGYEGVKDPLWFTKRLYEPIMSSKKAQRISYIMMWRNNDTKHHYMVYPGHPAGDDFINFINNPNIFSLSDIGISDLSK